MSEPEPKPASPIEKLKRARLLFTEGMALANSVGMKELAATVPADQRELMVAMASNMLGNSQTRIIEGLMWLSNLIGQVDPASPHRVGTDD